MLRPLQPHTSVILVSWKHGPRVCEGEDVVESQAAHTWLPLHGHHISIRWNPNHQEVVARPAAFGARPLFFLRRHDGVMLATSALRLVRERPLKGDLLDPNGVLDELGGNVLSGSRTMFAGIERVPPGWALRIRLHTRDLQLASDTHEDHASAPPPPSLLPILRDAVRQHMDPSVTTVPMSGGLDSALLFALAWETGLPVMAASFDDGEEPEGIPLIEQMVATRGARHDQIAIGLTAQLDAFADAVLCAESLLWNARAVSKFCFQKRLAVAGARRVLSGVGADEIFWGHPLGWDAAGGSNPVEARVMGDRGLAQRLCRAEGEAGPTRWLRGRAQTRLFFLRHTLPGSTLPPETISAARLGLDTRLPYLHPEVVRWALAARWSALVRGDLGKLPLRTAAQGLVPPQIIHARKAPVVSRPERHTQAWARLFERWLGSLEQARLSWLDLRHADDLLVRFERSPANDPELPRINRMLMRLASLAVLHDAAMNLLHAETAEA